jgi:hypothetical protein
MRSVIRQKEPQMAHSDRPDPPDHPQHPENGPNVEITIDGKPFKIHRGRQAVSVIKTLGGVPAAHQLDQDVNGVLTPIDQNGSVVIKGGEVFVSYPATGSSS